MDHSNTVVEEFHILGFHVSLFVLANSVGNDSSDLSAAERRGEDDQSSPGSDLLPLRAVIGAREGDFLSEAQPVEAERAERDGSGSERRSGWAQRVEIASHVRLRLAVPVPPDLNLPSKRVSAAHLAVLRALAEGSTARRHLQHLLHRLLHQLAQRNALQ